MRFLQYLRIAWEEAKKQRALDKQKERLLCKQMDYQYLEYIIQKINENPLLKVHITTNDGTTISLNTTPEHRAGEIEYLIPHDETWEIKQ